jgi:hypothetical protein
MPRSSESTWPPIYRHAGLLSRRMSQIAKIKSWSQ